MATQNRAPTSDETPSGTWSGSAGTRYQLVDDYPDSSGADYLTHGTTAGNLTFGFVAFSVPAGSTSISVQVRYYDRKNGSQSSAIGARLKVGGTYYNAATHNPANGTWTSRSDNWATNPKSGGAWTVDDVNGVGANALQAAGWNSTDASPTIDLASIDVQITYTPPQNSAYVFWAEMEAPSAPRYGKLSWAEIEAPAAPRYDQLFWAEIETPNAARAGLMLWSEMEVLDAPRLGQISWAELEAPLSPRFLQTSWAEMEVPTLGVPDRGLLVVWVEAELPDAPRTAVASWGELEVPSAPRQAFLSWVEVEMPNLEVVLRQWLIEIAEVDDSETYVTSVRCNTTSPNTGVSLPVPGGATAIRLFEAALKAVTCILNDRAAGN